MQSHDATLRRFEKSQGSRASTPSRSDGMLLPFHTAPLRPVLAKMPRATTARLFLDPTTFDHSSSLLLAADAVADASQVAAQNAVLDSLGRDIFVFLAASVEEGGPYSVVKTNEEGEALWGTSLPEHGEATDIAILTDNGIQKGYAITGHKNLQKGIDGSVTRLTIDGDVAWGATVGNPVGGKGEFAGLGAGNPSLIFDECWGVQTTDNGGAIMACGTGIEGCDEYEAGTALKSECQSDPRTKWRAMLVEVDQNGNEVWSRTDSFVFPGENEAAESASEYVFRTSSGGYASVIDQDFGIGLMVIEAP